jgi:2,5-dioxopentanoate dehydrogenase
MQEISSTPVDTIIANSLEGFAYLQQLSRQERAKLMYTIASEIEALGEELIQTAHQETNLPIPRLNGEKLRTINQWKLYADVVDSGVLVDARIDNGEGRSDIRKCNVGIGTVVVFGASNFPFAFSTAGGDTASAIGAGCPVVYKEHSAHPQTSRIMAQAIQAGLKKFGAPASVFGYVSGRAHEVGEALATNPIVKALAFTGSLQGGMALHRLGSTRKEPIPVFAEMGSLNPVIALEEYIRTNKEAFAKEYVGSLTLGTGQFCTNPGLLILIKGEESTALQTLLHTEIQQAKVGHMLHPGIRASYDKSLTTLDAEADVSCVGSSIAEDGTPVAAIYKATGQQFLANEILGEEVFGPCGLVIECADAEEVAQVLTHLGGQLTITFAATKSDVQAHLPLFDIAKEKCGRLLFNGMPTGVEVVYAMQHGGAYPASTDSRFTSVGPDSMKRFLRPLAFQNWPDELLPVELQDANPTKIERIVNNQRVLS